MAAAIPEGPKIFLSYAHLDNESGDGGDKREVGWVDRFQDGLSRRLKIYGKPFTIWRDTAHIADAERFTPKLLEAIRTCDLMIPVLSPVYIGKEWCRKELGLFAQRTDKPDIANRLVPVFRFPVEREDWPEEVKERVGYRFYRNDEISGRVVEYYKYGETKEHDLYDEEIEKIAAYVERFLPKAPPLVPVANPEKASGRITVFMADPAPDMYAAYDRIAVELRRQGVRVLTEENVDLPRDESLFGPALAEVVNQANLVVHLLGEDPGEKVGKVRLVDTQLDYTFSRADRPRLIWAPEVLLDDPTQPAGGRERKQRPDPLAVLQSFATYREGDELFKAPLEAFLQDLLRHCRRLMAPVLVQEERRDSGSAGPNVYVVGSAEDTAVVDAAAQILWDRLKIDARPSAFPDNADPDSRALHRKSMTEADALLYCWGNSSRSWIIQRANEATDIVRERGRPYLSTALLPVRPVESKGSFRSGALIQLYLTPSEEVTEVALQPFADKVLGAPPTGVTAK